MVVDAEVDVDDVDDVVRALEEEDDGRKWKEEDVLPGRYGPRRRMAPRRRRGRNLRGDDR